MLLALSPKGSWLIMSGRVPSSSIYKKKKKKAVHNFRLYGKQIPST